MHYLRNVLLINQTKQKLQQTNHIKINIGRLKRSTYYKKKNNHKQFWISYYRGYCCIKFVCREMISTDRVQTRLHFAALLQVLVQRVHPESFFSLCLLLKTVGQKFHPGLFLQPHFPSEYKCGICHIFESLAINKWLICHLLACLCLLTVDFVCIFKLDATIWQGLSVEIVYFVFKSRSMFLL